MPLTGLLIKSLNYYLWRSGTFHGFWMIAYNKNIELYTTGIAQFWKKTYSVYIYTHTKKKKKKKLKS